MQSRIILAIALIAFTFCYVTDVRGQEYSLDNVHTSVIFAVKHFDIGYTYGRFNTATGDVYIDDTIPENGRFQFKIDVKSIDSNDHGRDQHLKGPEFFDIEQFPDIEFQSKTITYDTNPKGIETFRATGIFKMHGKEKEITIPLQVTGKGNDKFGKERIGFLSKFAIKRSEFGMDQMLSGIGDTVAITFSTEVVRKDEP